MISPVASVHRFYYSDTDELDVELFSWWADELVVWFSVDFRRKFGRKCKKKKITNGQSHIYPISGKMMHRDRRKANEKANLNNKQEHANYGQT